MQAEPADRPRLAWTGWVVAAAFMPVLLAPWWRHHAFLRDFYDYGLVMAGVGRIETGERPYVDFVTPIQSGIFLFNGWAERLGGSTYQAMTQGAALLTMVTLALLYGLFVRRWPAMVSVVLAVAITGMGAAQHTIIWHNTVGLLCIAVAACGAALAPTWRRETWTWNLLVAAALVVGGVTKLNSQLVAVAGGAAWALHAGFTGRAEWSRVVITGGAILLFGFLIPVGFELAWTGASWSAWWYNVVALPLSSRSGDLAAALNWKFYLSVRHDYYGPMPVRALGAIGLLVTAIFVVTAIRSLGKRQAAWVIAAALFVAASGAGLLATNYEIAYVAMGGWFTLVAALWLGFGVPANGAGFMAGFLAPAALIGALAWHSAWQGQRSQFGYSLALRAEYVPAEQIAPDFAYLRGTLLPPEIAGSMRSAAAWYSRLSATERAGIFYGPGLEWLDRPWPVKRPVELPLWLHGGTSYGPAEQARLRAWLTKGANVRQVLVPIARDHWGPVVTPELQDRFLRRRHGPAWFRYERLLGGIVSWNPREFQATFGGNVNSVFLQTEHLVRQVLADGRSFLGVTEGRADLLLTAGSNRAQGEAVLQRGPGVDLNRELKVRFEVFSLADNPGAPLWMEEVLLRAEEKEKIVPFPLDSGGLPLRFVVSVKEESRGAVTAGWRALTILHTMDEGNGTPALLRQDAAPATLAEEEQKRGFLPVGWEPTVYNRGGHAGSDGFVLPPGGELWIKLSGHYRAIRGTAAIRAEATAGAKPIVRVMYVKGPKLEVMDQLVIDSPEREFSFRGWSAESDGWLAVLVDPSDTAPPVSIRLSAAER